MNKPNLSSSTTEFLDQHHLPKRPEINLLRSLILESCPQLLESIKWNGPNYSDGGKDRITFRIFPPTQFQVIFHLGAKANSGIEKSAIKDSSGLLIWKSADRALIAIPNLNWIETKKSELTAIIQSWIESSKSI